MSEPTRCRQCGYSMGGIGRWDLKASETNPNICQSCDGLSIAHDFVNSGANPFTESPASDPTTKGAGTEVHRSTTDGPGTTSFCPLCREWMRTMATSWNHARRINAKVAEIYLQGAIAYRDVCHHRWMDGV